MLCWGRGWGTFTFLWDSLSCCPHPVGWIRRELPILASPGGRSKQCSYRASRPQILGSCSPGWFLEDAGGGRAVTLDLCLKQDLVINWGGGRQCGVDS